MIRYLAESENYKVTSEHEMVFLHFKNNRFNRPLYIGDFYGDPECAIISKDEQYIVMAGCGLIIYRLQEPFDEYSYCGKPEQCIELFREPTNIWWINGLHQNDVDSDWKFFKFVVANGEGELIYKMDSTTFALEKIGT